MTVYQSPIEKSKENYFKSRSKGFVVENGIRFSKGTPKSVMSILSYYANKGNSKRIRIFYGNPTTGLDWGEEYHSTIGKVVKTKDLLTNTYGLWLKYSDVVGYSEFRQRQDIDSGCIVRITVDKKDVYLNPKYKCDVVVKNNWVYLNGACVGCFKTNDKAKEYAAYLEGTSNKMVGWKYRC